MLTAEEADQVRRIIREELAAVAAPLERIAKSTETLVEGQCLRLSQERAFRPAIVNFPAKEHEPELPAESNPVGATATIQ